MNRGQRLLPAALCLVLAACGGGSEPAGSGPPSVVATTTQVTDLARNVAGDRTEVRGLLTANTDPHDYEVRASDLDGLADAGLVLRSGGDLDDWLGDALESAGGGATVLTLGDPGGPDSDPHWWQDPRIAMVAVGRIRDALTDADPGGAETYRANARAYLARLRALDRAVAACVGSIPAADRRLVTTHDALGHYARRYGLEVVGAVIPSRSTRGQPSAGETAELIDVIRREGVKAIFAESSVNPKVEQAIARESGATVGAALYADTLGPKGSSGDTYLKSIRANTQALAEGLTGGRRTCRLPNG